MLMNNVFSFLDFEPNAQQKVALQQITDFIKSDNDVFILKGSAGTGKTSIVKAITTHLTNSDINQRIAAPTGRAAMIIGSKTGQSSKTMHSQIYTPEKIKNGGGVRLIRKTNQEKAMTIFLVDEASMVSNILTKSENFFVSKPLLEDYIDYVKQGNKDNKIIFIGDKFQLPPVNETFSPALSPKFLSKHFELKSVEYELTQVMRQDEGSGILRTATFIRDLLERGISNSPISIDREKYPSNALNRYLTEFDVNDINKVIAICHSNRDVNYWNNWIRQQLGLSSSILANDDIIVTQNTWLNNSGDWVYKGEYGKIIELETTIEKYANLNFADAKIEYATSNGESKIISTKVLLDSLNTRYGILDEEKEKQLFAEVMKHNPQFRTSQNNADDKYLGAIRLKHGYATTCHKAQGGEWDNVLIHPWTIGKDLKWTYTAITRAKKEVYSYAA